jgi:CubicO group peptidase (beta-lactamase class C family)
MKIVRRSPVAAVLLALVLAASTAAAKTPDAAPAWPLPVATPESQGMSSERLARLHEGVQRFVDEGRHAGAVSLIARNGKIVDFRTYGKRDLEGGLPMEKDTICRIYSMSKIVTSVAVLSLLEEARFQLDDPVADTLPELGRMKVLTGGTEEKPRLADLKTPITIRHLLTHTSGLTYDFGDGTIDKIFRQVKPFDASSLAEFVERVGHLPLAHEPGERFTYGVSTDVLGALVESCRAAPWRSSSTSGCSGPWG